MGCTNCKKKKTKQNVDETSSNPFFNLDRGIGFGIGFWFVLGLYGLVSVIKDLIELFR